jgi:ribosomal protein S18 acetylase RimI-like enzyme
MSNPSALLRPMRSEDVPDAERLCDEAFLDADRALTPPALPAPVGRSPGRSREWIERTRHFLTTDPGGCWAAEVNGTLVGFATSYRRDLTWFLATYAVRPGLQGAGIGRMLLDAALGHGRGCLRAMVSASGDPKAFRRYRLAGFTMHPQLALTGRVDRSAIPALRHVREGSGDDFALLDSVDRRCRDAAHGPDHELLARFHRLVVIDRPGSSGYAYLSGSGPALVAATDRRTAAELLWESLASCPPDEPASVRHVTAVNDWAVDVGLAARLAVHQEGYLALRGMKPPMPYLHNGSFL